MKYVMLKYQGFELFRFLFLLALFYFPWLFFVLALLLLFLFNDEELLVILFSTPLCPLGFRIIFLRLSVGSFTGIGLLYGTVI